MTPTKPLLATVLGQRQERPPVWIMRQAGRYLPEYRETRSKAKTFLELCYNPDLATEVTLQPLRRFPLDAAIVFSDILVVPLALGQKVWFVEGEGPRLEPLRDGAALAGLGAFDRERLAPVYETIARVRAALPPETALLGFCGAPWTLATYMVEGRGSADQSAARLLAFRDPPAMQALIERLIEATLAHLVAQVDAGADAVQVFDSWAGNLPFALFDSVCVRPMRTIVDRFREARPGVPVIVFPRAAGSKLRRFAGAVPADGIGIDTAEDRIAALRAIPGGMAVQGNLDPLLLVAGGASMDREVDSILADFAGRPAIFNLGHGVRQDTPPEHVARLVARVQGAA
jgi:uroporphyrinogen decarboxylase